ncbi:uncharacterized protein LOC135207146 [Macrobrachium nipponense]|uniref:uncharacterized protein LOC135207146 n=1 Tax=Macrobrachium nipponense TaxID=159736 RepID=UPI0030C7C517
MAIGFIYQLTMENSKEDCENIELIENVQSDNEFTDGHPKDTGSEVYSNAAVTSIMDNISCIATSVSPTTTIRTARPTFATNTATTSTPPPTAATTTTTTNDNVDCFILNGNDNLQKPEIQYETIQLGLHEEGEPTFKTIKSNESTSSLQRRNTKQCALIKKQRMQICRLMKKLEQIKVSQKNCDTCALPSTIIKNASKYISGTALEFFKTQMKLAGVSKYGRRYSLPQKCFSLGLYFKSPRAYNFISKIFTLPTTRMLRYWVSKIDFNVGWNESVFKLLKQKALSMNENDKYCGIIFDAISLKSDVQFNISKDVVEGFEDLGQYGKRQDPAQYAMVFMAKGLASKWKQVLGYFLFTKSIKGDTLMYMVTDCIGKLKNVCLYPTFLVCDQDPNNRRLFKNLNISIENLFSHMKVKNMYFFYDTPHLLKSIRNNFKKYDIQVDGQKVSWKYIEKFFEADSQMWLRLAPKLTASHVFNTGFDKMRVNLAAQVFSRSVAAGLFTHAALGALPQEAENTALFVNDIDELFDVFNSSCVFHFKERKCAISDSNNNINFLSEKADMLSKLTFIGTKSNIPCIDG